MELFEKVGTSMFDAMSKWFRFAPDQYMLGSPPCGEWCLWSMMIDGKRSYYSGTMLESDGEFFVRLEGINKTYNVTMLDRLYWARVRQVTERECRCG